MDINQKAINYLKSITAETISNAKSGHTGSAIGASSILFALFKDHLRFSTQKKQCPVRDRFVLSAGHASALLYSCLHLFGFDISVEDLKSFRTCGSKTPGHPEYNVVPAVETTTCPLGQGIANAVGMAIAESMLCERFGKELVSNYTYCYAGDGCLMEGVGMEACSLAGALKLNKLILLYDSNNITIDGNTNIATVDDMGKKFEAMGWRVIFVKNGNEYKDCTKAIAAAKKSDKPVIVIFKTVIGLGTKKAGTNAVHAYPLPKEELAEFKTALGVEGSFYVPDEIYDYCRISKTKNEQLNSAYNNLINNLKVQNSEKYKEFFAYFKQKNINYAKILSTLVSDGEMAGRDACGKVLNEISKIQNNFVGGTADLAPSTKAYINDGGDFSENNRLGKNIHFGIREHAMGAVANGIALYSDLYVFDSTFLAFSNYMLPPLKMRAMMNAPVLSVFTHDSIDIGEDGPTHQPIEQLGQLRQIVGLNVIRPATFSEMVAAYKIFVETKTPTVIVATKSKIKELENSSIESAEHGGYAIFETKTSPKIEIFATGREVALAIEVAKLLESEGARVISVPCEKLFDSQPDSYKKTVRLKSSKLKVAIEASCDYVWHKYVGENGLIFGVTDYQTSGNGNEVYFNAGFDSKLIAKKIKANYKKIK